MSEQCLLTQMYSGFREGSVEVNLEATTVDHPDARDHLFVRLNSLDLDSLFAAPVALNELTCEIP